MSRHIALHALAVAGLAAALTSGGTAAAAAAVPEGSGAGPAAEPAACRQQAKIVCVSKATRTLTYLENGREWLSAEVRFGRPGYETPTGTWKVDTKAPDTWWSYPYQVFMPWGMKFDSKQGLYIHYSSGFSLNHDGYIGSHGCVQLGDWETARKLYERVPVGTTVTIY